LSSDLIVFNGTILSLRSPREIFRWMALKDGRILARGVEESFIPYLGENTEVLDLKGLTVVPGFYDSHVHLVQSGLNTFGIDLREVTTIGKILELIKEKTLTLPKGQLIRGYHLDVTRIEEKRFPTRQEIDQASPEHPVWINSIEYHTSAVNTLALNSVNLPYNIDGIKRDERSLPLGYFTGKASAYIRNRLLAQIDATTREEGVLIRIDQAIRQGITTIDAMEGGFTFHEEDARFIAVHRNKYPIDIHLFYQSFDLEKARTLGVDAIGGDIFIDGAFNSRTAAISKKYLDMDTCGNLYFNQDELDYFVMKTVEEGWQLSLHAIGDRAIEQTLKAYERAYEAHGSLRRCRIEHFELASMNQMKRAGQLGLIISVQPSFEYFWGYPGGMYDKRLDPSLSSITNNFRAMVDEGILLIGGSDSDVTDIDPLLGIHAAVNHPKPQFALSPFEALRMFTANAAYASFEENIKGTLEVGKLGDFCILSQNPLQVDPAEIKNTRVMGTFKEGHYLYLDPKLVLRGDFK